LAQLSANSRAKLLNAIAIHVML